MYMKTTKNVHLLLRSRSATRSTRDLTTLPSPKGPKAGERVTNSGSQPCSQPDSQPGSRPGPVVGDYFIFMNY